MTKTDLIENLYLKTKFSKKEAGEIFEEVLALIKATLAKGEDIKIVGFGNFLVRKKPPRPGRNPQTGEPIEISSRRVLTFKPSPVLRAALNGKGE